MSRLRNSRASLSLTKTALTVITVLLLWLSPTACLCEQSNGGSQFADMKKSAAAAPAEARSRLQSSEGENTKYPPYPEVWDWYEKSGRSAVLGMYMMQDGDVLLLYERQSIPGGRRWLATTFFGRKRITNKKAEEIVEVQFKKSRKSASIASIPEWLRYQASSSDGLWKIGLVDTFNTECYEGPNRNPYKIVNTRTGKEKIFTLFRLLENPEKFFVDGIAGPIGTKDENTEFPKATCRSERRRTIQYQVKSVSGDFLFLNDNTFLFRVEGTGLIIRFDTNLESGSILMNRSFFMIENSGEPWVIDELTGKQYDDTVDTRVIVNDLYSYLKSKRRKD